MTKTLRIVLWIVFALVVVDAVSPTKTYSVPTRNGGLLIMTDSIWAYWLHCYTAGAKPYDPKELQEVDL